VEGTVREVKRRVRVVASSYRAIDRSVTRWIVVTIVEWSSEVRWVRCQNKMVQFLWSTVYIIHFVRPQSDIIQPVKSNRLAD